MATVTNTVKLPDGSTPDRVDVVIELVASTTGRAAGWITATDVTLEATVRPTVTNGAWTASLTPNADITPSGSVYKVTEYVDKTRYTHYIEVDSDGGSLFDLLTDAPATVESSALGAHKADTTDAHDASAISVLDTAGRFAGSDVETVLAEVAVAAAAARTGNKAVIIGDSIAIGSDSTANYHYGNSWFSDACIKSAGKLRILANVGIGGNTSTQMLARFASDVTAYHPDIVVIAAVSPNDINASIPAATTKANIRAMVAAAQADGSRVMFASSCAHDTTATKDALTSLNAWLVEYANSIGAPVLDVYSPVVDVSDGTYATANTSDGVHPNDTGIRLIGTAVAAALPADLRAAPFLTVSSADGGNMVKNGCFVGDANADGVADSWSFSGSATSKSISTPVSNGFGNWQQMTSNGAFAAIGQTISTGFSVGDTLAFGCRLTKSAAIQATMGIVLTGASASPTYVRGISNVTTTAITDGYLYAEFVVPAGTTALVVQLSFTGSSGSSAQIAQVTLRNLTTLGIA